MSEPIFYRNPKSSGQRAMWNAVAWQAVVDLFTTPKGWGADAELVRMEALQWLTADKGDDKEARDYVCNLAGIDSDSLRARVLKALDGENIDLTSNRDQEAGLRDARETWHKLRHRPKVKRMAFNPAGLPEVAGTDGPFNVNTFGALFYNGEYFPAGKYRGHFLPSTQFGIGKVFAAVTRPRGGNLSRLRHASAKHWEELKEEICEKWELDFVWLKDGFPSDESVPDAKCYFIPRPLEVSTSLAA